MYPRIARGGSSACRVAPSRSHAHWAPTATQRRSDAARIVHHAQAGITATELGAPNRRMYAMPASTVERKRLHLRHQMDPLVGCAPRVGIVRLAPPSHCHVTPACTVRLRAPRRNTTACRAIRATSVPDRVVPTHDSSVLLDSSARVARQFRTSSTSRKGTTHTQEPLNRSPVLKAHTSPPSAQRTVSIVPRGTTVTARAPLSPLSVRLATIAR